MFDVDTHDSAVQASAARLIADLHHTYPEILQIDGSSYDIAITAQGSLSAYLGALIEEKSFDAEEYAVAKENETIASTIQLIDYIRGLPDIPAEDKKAIFEQILEFAVTHPGNSDKWDENQKHWSTNHYFNPVNKRYEFSITSPAEALNLVCRALFDNDRHILNEGESEGKNLALRVKTIYNYFLCERNIVKSGIRNKCAAGLQHDVLYLLNHSFLDNPRDQGGKPIKLLMKKSAFLQECISLFLTELWESNPGENINRLLIDWQAWQRGDTDDECPLVVWLRNHFPMNDGTASDNPDAAWQTACRDYVKSRGLEFWVEIKDKDLSAFVATIGNLPIPKENIDHCYLLEIMGKQQLILPLRNDKLKTLIELRNQVLDRFKAIYWRIEPSQIRLDIVFNLLDSVDRLYRYGDLSYLLGETDRAFYSARQDLQIFLLDCFYNLNNSFEILIDNQFNEEQFETLHKSYCEQENHFLQQSHLAFITDFFAILVQDEPFAFIDFEFKAAFNRYKQLKKDSDPVHPLIFSDQELANLANEVVREGDIDVLNITPYIVNRLFLHGLIVPIADWSDIYCQALGLVAGWLSTPAQLQQGLLNDFKQNYPHEFLFNLKLLSLLPKNARETLRELEFGDSDFVFTIIRFKTDIILDYWESIEPKISWLIVEFNHLVALLNCRNLTQQHSTKVLTAIEFRPGEWIKNIDQLVPLLECCSLSDEQRTQIFAAVQPRFRLIHRDYILNYLLNCDKLTDDQRTQILAAVQNKLGDILDNHTLLNLLRCEKLTEGHRTQILNAFEDQLLHYHLYNLQVLLELDNLSKGHRTQILDVYFNKQEQLIFNEYLFLDLLNCDKLTKGHRTLILNAVKNQAQLIKNRDNLNLLLNCAKLTESHRTLILDAIPIADLIRFPEALKELLTCRYLIQSQKRQILIGIQTEFGEWINHDNDFRDLIIPNTEVILIELKNLFSASLQHQTENEKKTEVKRNEQQLKNLSQYIHKWINDNYYQAFVIWDVIFNLTLVLQEAVGLRFLNIDPGLIINNLDRYKTNLTLIQTIASHCDNYLASSKIDASRKNIVKTFREKLEVNNYRTTTTAELLNDFKNSFIPQRRTLASTPNVVTFFFKTEDQKFVYLINDLICNFEPNDSVRLELRKN